MPQATGVQPLGERLKSERGVSLIMVAIAILVLTGFLVFVLDYGVMWLSRRQAQNAADAGALAGAVARAYDETANPPSAGGMAELSAETVAQATDVFGEPGGVNVTWDCPAFAAGGRCVRVDVHRDGTAGSTALPTFFAQMFGAASQNVRATATAWVQTANATNCMRPFAVADKWDMEPEGVPPAGPGDPVKFDRWVKAGNSAVELSPRDVYVPVNAGSPGTGYTVAADLGAEVFLKRGNPAQTADDVQPGWSLPVRLPDGEGGYMSGAADFKDAIKFCIGNPVRIGDYLPLENGVMQGPTLQGVQNDGDSLVNQDPNAEWDTATNAVEGSCAPTCAPFSPRIVPIAVFDMDEFQWRKAQNDWQTEWVAGVGPGGAGTGDVCPGGGGCIRVVNIIGFFVDELSGSDVKGRVAMYPGEFITGPPAVNEAAGFLVSIQLIR